MSYTEKDFEVTVTKIFEKFDKDKNGALDKEEFNKMLTTFYQRFGKSKPSHV